MGYTYFDIPKLTTVEMNLLIEAHNHEIKEQEKIMKKSRSKMKKR